MSAGVTFGSIHSDDLGLKWLGVFFISPPEPETKYITIPGRNGSVDYSEALTGYITYKDRPLETKFEMEVRTEEEYMAKISKIMNALHGKRTSVVLDTDPEYAWDCRLQVKNTRNNIRYCNVTVTGAAYPYKRKVTETVIEQTLTDSATDIICNNQAEPVVPTIETTGSTEIVFGGRSISVSAGTHILDIIFEAGENILTVSGSGKIKIIYREGSL